MGDFWSDPIWEDELDAVKITIEPLFGRWQLRIDLPHEVIRIPAQSFKIIRAIRDGITDRLAEIDPPMPVQPQEAGQAVKSVAEDAPGQP